jgi:DNA replication and repair protein RecF
VSQLLAVTRLTVDQFRNHTARTLRLDPRPVCLVGPNGVGKTNLLEALSILLPGRGLRGAELAEMAQGGPEAAAMRPRAWTVAAELQTPDGPVQLGVAAERGPDGRLKRISRRDGQAVTGTELARLLRLSWLTPAMDRLFVGPGGDRRRFLDRLALAIAPEHGTAVGAYERALRERQRLLEDGRPNPSWLAGLEREMAAHGAAVAAARVAMVAALVQEIGQREGTFPAAALALQGTLEAALAAGQPSSDVEDAFLAELSQQRRRDAAAGRALSGPHRTDLVVTHRAKNRAAADCSTGEQKALLLGLVLAHARALVREPGGGPTLVLLDEAVAHLDPVRRAALFDELVDLPGQVWLTGTEAAAFSAFGGRAQVVELGA